jgi:hypothetical protein
MHSSLLNSNLVLVRYLNKFHYFAKYIFGNHCPNFGLFAYGRILEQERDVFLLSQSFLFLF